MFENPIIGDKEEEEDQTLPNLELQDQKINALVGQITELFGKNLIKRPVTPENSNSKFIKSENGTKIKNYIAKVGTGLEYESNKNTILNAFKTGKESTLLVSTYKIYLSQLGISGLSKFNKTGLIEMVRRYHGL